jgi:hypothetical protein
VSVFWSSPSEGTWAGYESETSPVTILVRDEPEVFGGAEYAMSGGKMNDCGIGPIEKPGECIQAVAACMLEC